MGKLPEVFEIQKRAGMQNLTCIQCKYNQVCKYAKWLQENFDPQQVDIEEGCTLDDFEKRIVRLEYERNL